MVSSKRINLAEDTVKDPRMIKLDLEKVENLFCRLKKDSILGIGLARPLAKASASSRVSLASLDTVPI